MNKKVLIVLILVLTLGALLFVLNREDGQRGDQTSSEENGDTYYQYYKN